MPDDPNAPSGPLGPPPSPPDGGLPPYPGNAPPSGTPDPWYTPPRETGSAPGGYYYPPGSPPPPSGQWGGDPGYGPSGPPPGAAPYAGYWARVGGLIIDGILVYVVSLVYELPAHAISTTTTDINGTTARHLHVNGGGVVVPLAIGLLYTGLMIGLRGQTLGMMAVRVRAIDAYSGQLIGFWRAFGRDLIGRVFSFLVLPAIIDLLFPLWDPRNQTLHDKIINSVVIRA